MAIIGRKDNDIKEARLAIGLSRERVAGFLGVSVSTIIRYETNPACIPVSAALILAKLYRKSVDDMMFCTC